MLTLDRPSATQIEPRPARTLDLADTFPADRRCIETGCITVLCIYNPGPACYCHTRPTDLEEDPWPL